MRLEILDIYILGPFFQTKRFDRYKEVIAQLIESGNAYRCYCTPEEVEAMREEARAKGVSLIVFLSL